MSDVLPTIPTLQNITQPPSLGRPTAFDQEAEAYLYSQYGLMQDLNTVIGVLNPVAQAVLQYRLTAEQAANQTASDLQAIQQIAIQTGQDADTAVQAATTASQHLTATAEERQTAEQAAQLATAKAQEAAQSAIEAGPTHLSQTRTADTLTIHSSTGDDVELPAATPTEAGLMSAADKQKLVGPTNLSVTRSATAVTVKSSTGTAAVLPSATTTQAGLLSAADKQALNGKQATLVSGSNIKKINGQSLLGSGELTIGEELFNNTNTQVVTFSGSGNMTVFTVPSGKVAKVVISSAYASGGSVTVGSMVIVAASWNGPNYSVQGGIDIPDAYYLSAGERVVTTIEGAHNANVAGTAFLEDA